MKKNKYEYLWVIQGNYGFGLGWEDLSAYNIHREARIDFKLYRENETHIPHRLIQRRVLREFDHENI